MKKKTIVVAKKKELNVISNLKRWCDFEGNIKRESALYISLWLFHFDYSLIEAELNCFFGEELVQFLWWWDVKSERRRVIGGDKIQYWSLLFKFLIIFTL
jgi:hypothetical protein